MDCHDIWGIGRLWTREQLITLWHAIRVTAGIRLRLGLAHLLLVGNDTVAEAAFYGKFYSTECSLVFSISYGSHESLSIFFPIRYGMHYA